MSSRSSPGSWRRCSAATTARRPASNWSRSARPRAGSAVFHIIPALGILSLLAAIYGIYLFYTGVTPVMNVPSGRVIGYLIALIVAVIVVYIVIFALVGAIAGAGMMAGGMM